VTAADQVPPGRTVRAGIGIWAASGTQALDFLRSHASQVEADDRGGGAQMPHQLRGLAEVHVLAP